MSIWPVIKKILEQGQSCQLVTIVEARGSTPRELDARMVVSLDGIAGTIGGGELELQAIKFARRRIARNTTELARRSYSLGPDLGQCCGGRVELRFEGFDQSRFLETAPLAKAEKRGIVITHGEEIDGLIYRTPQENGEYTDAAAGVIIESFGVECTDLAIFGAGHVAKALMISLAPLPFKITIIDNRRDVFPAQTPHNVTCVVEDDPTCAIGSLRAQSQILVMTHNHQLDLNIVAAALNDSRFSYLGLIGSKTKRKRFFSQLRTLGFSKSQLKQITCPIGIGDIRSKEPASIAIAVAAQLLFERESLKGS